MFDDDESRHAKKSCRLNRNEPFFVTDGKGCLVKAVFGDKERKHSNLSRITEIIDTSDFPEKKIALTVACSVVDGKRFEDVVSKTTEVGASEIQPIISDRSQKFVLKADRLFKIAVSAIKQSGRVYLPEIRRPITLSDFLRRRSFVPNECCYMEKENCGKKNNDMSSVRVILIGPEGGWTDEEIELFCRNGFRRLSLGFTTLRVETAATIGTALAIDAQINSKGLK
ncbi:16S rRNA (uracil(1498)-N(3))-methyltransferase [candidate division WOR-3 bacterium]|nr:16S rRNA (uracil(1498)-N(3))-methyltransferase [candidate division WOR-3 bacterium]